MISIILNIARRNARYLLFLLLPVSLYPPSLLLIASLGFQALITDSSSGVNRALRSLPIRKGDIAAAYWLLGVILPLVLLILLGVIVVTSAAIVDFPHLEGKELLYLLVASWGVYALQWCLPPAMVSPFLRRYSIAYAFIAVLFGGAGILPFFLFVFPVRWTSEANIFLAALALTPFIPYGYFLRMRVIDACLNFRELWIPAHSNERKAGRDLLIAPHGHLLMGSAALMLWSLLLTLFPSDLNLSQMIFAGGATSIIYGAFSALGCVAGMFYIIGGVRVLMIFVAHARAIRALPISTLKMALAAFFFCWGLSLLPLLLAGLFYEELGLSLATANIIILAFPPLSLWLIVVDMRCEPIVRQGILAVVPLLIIAFVMLSTMGDESGWLLQIAVTLLGMSSPVAGWAMWRGLRHDSNVYRPRASQLWQAY